MPKRVKSLTAQAFNHGIISRKGTDNRDGHLLDISTGHAMAEWAGDTPVITIYPAWDPPSTKNIKSDEYSRILPGKEVMIEYQD